MDRYVDIRGWTSGPLHGRKSRPCASWYLHAFARADAVLIQVDTIAWNVLKFPVQHCFFLYIAFGSISISCFLEDPVFLARHCAFLSLSCLPMPLGFLRYAGGWHLRSKPCAVLSPFYCVSHGILPSLLYFSSICRYHAAFGCSLFT